MKIGKSIKGLALGSLAVYLFHPKYGAQHRALVKEKVGAGLKQAQGLVEQSVSYVRENPRAQEILEQSASYVRSNFPQAEPFVQKTMDYLRRSAQQSGAEQERTSSLDSIQTH